MQQTQTWQCDIEDLGLVDYDTAYSFQKSHVEKVLSGGNQKLILCEHPPVLTLGRLTDPNNILFSENDLRKQGVCLRKIDRGGDVTLHAPGQLVVYPVFDLTHYGKDLKSYLHGLEDVVIDVLAALGVEAGRDPLNTGVWVKEKKIASIGIGVRRWVSFHGIGLNVSTDLNLFSLIRPCGLDVSMTSVDEVAGENIPMARVKEEILDSFQRHFQLVYIKKKR